MENLNNPIFWEVVARVLWETIAYSCLATLIIGVPVKIAKYVAECDHWVINGLNQAFMWIVGVTIALLVMFMVIIFGQIFSGTVRFNAIIE